jgi:hypothetical protein
VCRVDDSNCSRTDLGIGDFWVTSERLGYGIKFLIPSYSADDMYLIAPNAKKPKEALSSFSLCSVLLRDYLSPQLTTTVAHHS